MSVVASLPCVYPETLLDEPPSPWDRRWWVMYTKVHQEKALAEQLLGYEIPYYLPLVPKASNRRGRRVVAHVPMFAGYVFLFGSDEERVRGLTTNRVSRVLYVDDLDRLSHDLRQLQCLIASGAPLTIESRLQPGKRVRVRYGSLAGLEGMILKRHSTSRLLIAVDFLQQGASVEIEDHAVEPID